MLYFQFPFTREHFEFKVYSRNMKRCQMYLSLQYGPMHKYNASLVFVFAIWPQSSEQCILDWCEDNSQVLHLFCGLTPLVWHHWSHTNGLTPLVSHPSYSNVHTMKDTAMGKILSGVFAAHTCVASNITCALFDHSWVLYLLCSLISLLSAVSWGILSSSLYSTVRCHQLLFPLCSSLRTMQCNVLGAFGGFSRGGDTRALLPESYSAVRCYIATLVTHVCY